MLTVEQAARVVAGTPKAKKPKKVRKKRAAPKSPKGTLRKKRRRLTLDRALSEQEQALRDAANKAAYGEKARIEWQGLVAHVWYDDRDPTEARWVAEYSDGDGLYDDSEKVWSESMPRRRDSARGATRAALRALKREARRRSIAAS